MAFAPFVAAGTPPRGWQTYYVPNTPLTLQLPEAWQAFLPSPKMDGERLALSSPTNPAASMYLTAAPSDESWPQFRARIFQQTQMAVLTEDPHASVRFRVVSLPA